LPDGTRELGQHEPGRVWLDRLPGLLDEVVERWRLSIGDAFSDASASLTLRATTPDGEAVVLKRRLHDADGNDTRAVGGRRVGYRLTQSRARPRRPPRAHHPLCARTATSAKSPKAA
jgi:hypothetical protein